MDQNLYSGEVMFNDLEDITPDNNPYNLLEIAIEKKDSQKMLELCDKCEKDMYLAVILSDFENILSFGSDELLSRLSNLIYTHEYTEYYNRLFTVNQFRTAVKNKDAHRMMDFVVREKDSIALPYLAENLDELLKYNHMTSDLAACFTGTKYVSEYIKVCERINQLISGDQGNTVPRYRS